jgi:predicted TIM-barrel fold metal-dependent hydrolase
MSPQPARVVDAHAHVFERSLPMVDDRRYTPDRDATLAHYLEQLDAHGFSHGVLVQPSFLGTDNGYLLEALRAGSGRLRGVAVVDPSVGEDELGRLLAAGVVGVRLNLVGRALPDFHAAAWPLFQARLQRLGLHVEIHCAAAQLPQVLPTFLDAGNVVVVDHFGRPEGPSGCSDAGFQYLLSAAARGQVWVKLSAAYRLGAGDGASFDGPQATAALLGAFGAARLVWGSDWPHTHFTGRMDFATSRQLLDALVPDPAVRNQILGVSPATLYFQR